MRDTEINKREGGRKNYNGKINKREGEWESTNT